MSPFLLFSVLYLWADTNQRKLQDALENDHANELRNDMAEHPQRMLPWLLIILYQIVFLIVCIVMMIAFIVRMVKELL